MKILVNFPLKINSILLVILRFILIAQKFILRGFLSLKS